MKLFLLSLFVVCAAAERSVKVKLEDIERDNLLNERRSQGKENLVAQQSQHLRPPSILSQNQYGHQERAEEEAAYAQAPAATGYEAPDNHIEYVHPQAPTYVRQEYSHGPVQPHPTYVPQVHEAEQTYTVPSRQSLSYPIIGGSVPLALAPQPQYVYVQAGPAQQQFQHRHQFVQQPEFVQPPQYVGLTYPKLPAQYIQNIHQIPVPRPQITTHSEVTSHVDSHTERPTITITSTVSPLPSRHHQSVAPIEYVPSLKVQPSVHHQQLPHHHQTYYFSAPPQYQYASSHHNSLNFPPQPVYNFDFFNHQHASSLLDSYIPSSVVIARQHAQAAKYQSFQHSHGAASAPGGYNTLSFSAPHPQHYGGAHYKRSSPVVGKGQSKP